MPLRDLMSSNNQSGEGKAADVRTEGREKKKVQEIPLERNGGFVVVDYLVTNLFGTCSL